MCLLFASSRGEGKEHGPCTPGASSGSLMLSCHPSECVTWEICRGNAGGGLARCGLEGQQGPAKEVCLNGEELAKMVGGKRTSPSR